MLNVLLFAYMPITGEIKGDSAKPTTLIWTFSAFLIQIYITLPHCMQVWVSKILSSMKPPQITTTPANWKQLATLLTLEYSIISTRTPDSISVQIISELVAPDLRLPFRGLASSRNTPSRCKVVISRQVGHAKSRDSHCNLPWALHFTLCWRHAGSS